MHSMRACVRALSPRAPSSLSLPLLPQAEIKRLRRALCPPAGLLCSSLAAFTSSRGFGRARARKERPTESDREVKDEATPQHAGDGLDGHCRENMMCVLRGIRSCWFVGLV